MCRSNLPVYIKQQEIPEEITSNFTTVLQDFNWIEDTNEYEVVLNLYNVDHSAVGYYGCYDNTVDSEKVLTEIDHELVNTKHISYVYIYVNGEVHKYHKFYKFIYYLYLIYYKIFRNNFVRTKKGDCCSKKSNKSSN